MCREPFYPSNSLQKVCGMACALDMAQSDKEKKFKAETREMKSKMLDNDKSFHKAKAQKAFNEYIRLRDSKEPCISCKKEHELPGKWNAGHYYTVAARPDLRFNENNCHKQCEHCNSYKSGNISLYTPNLIAKIGQEAFDAMERSEFTPYRLEDYKDIHRIYTGKIKELKKLSQPNSV